MIYKNLGDLKGKQILDVGSRLGAVLYAGYYFSNASSLIGVEINNYFVNLQKDTVKKFKLSDRIQIIAGDIFNQATLFEKSDVIVLHNVFEMFHDLEKNRECWNKIRKMIQKKGQIIVASPSLEQSFKELKLKHLTLEGWIKPLEQLKLEENDICFYQVE